MGRWGNIFPLVPVCKTCIVFLGMSNVCFWLLAQWVDATLSRNERPLILSIFLYKR